MKKFLSKLALLLTCSAMTLGVGVAAFENDYKEAKATDYVSTWSATTSVPASGDDLEASTTDPAEATYTWTTDATGIYQNYSEDTRGLQTGSNGATCSYQKFISSAFSGYVIKSIDVKAKSNGTNPAVTVSIGGHAFDSQDLTTTYDTYSFDNSTTNYSGELIVQLSKDAGTKYLMCASIIVNYTNVAKDIVGLEASLKDNTKNYYADEEFPTSDISLVVTYDDSSTDTVTDGSGITITSGSPLVEGSNTLNLSYTNVYGTDTTTLAVTAKPAKVLDHYAITGDLTKKNYYDGDDWDLSGLELYAHYTSGLDELDPVLVGTVPDLVTAGDLVLTLSPSTALFGTRKLNLGAIQYLSTDVASVKISGIQVEEQVKFIKYTSSTLEDGDYCLVYDSKALNNVDVYQDHKNRRLGADNVSSSIQENKLVAPNEKNIFKITEVDDVNHYYTIQDANDKYVIHSGSGSDNYIAMNASLGDTAKWTVAFDNTEKTYDFSNVAYSSYKIRLNSSYYATNKSTTGGPFTLYKKPVPYVSLAAEKYDLGIGDEITITATRLNGATGFATISIDDDSLVNFVDNGDNTATLSVKNGILTSGEVVVTAELMGSSASILLNISNVVSLSSIAIKTNPKLNYIVGESIDFSGLEVEATFSDGHKEDVTSEISLTDTSGIDTSVKGSYEITASYTYLELTRTASFTISFAYPVLNVAEAIAQIVLEDGETAGAYEVHGIVCKTNDGVYIADRYNEQDKTKMLLLWGLNNSVASELVIGSTISVESKLKYYSSHEVYETLQNPTVLDYDANPELLVSYVTIYREPERTDYYVGDTTFNYAGLKVKLHYNDSTTVTYVYSDDPEAFLTVFDITDPNTSVSKAYVPVTVTHKASGFYNSFNVSVSDVKVSSIVVTTNPTKTEYASGETFDPAGIVVTAHNNNGSEFVVTDPEKLTYRTPSNDGKVYEGDTYVTVIYDNNNNITKNIPITVLEKYIVNITASLSEGWNDDTYDIGSSFSTKSLVIRVNYSDGTEDKYNSKTGFSLFTITPPDMSTAGDKDVSITLKGTTHTTTVQIHIMGVEDLSIDTLPYRTTYRVGDALDFTGLELVALYSDSHLEDVNPSWENVTITGNTSKDGPQQTITFTYKGKSASYKIDVWLTDEGLAALVEAQLTAIRNSVDQDLYTETNWQAVQAIISDLESTLNSFDAREEGQHYTSDVMGYVNLAKEEIAKIPVKSLHSITVSGPSKTNYVVGDTLDLTGLVVTAHFDDGSSKVLTSNQYAVETENVDMSVAGTKTVTVSFGGKSTTFTVTVNAAPVTLVSIEIKTNPNKTTYTTGEELDTTGLVLIATYSDQSTKEITSGFSTSGYNKNVAGTQTITVTFNGKTTTFQVTVNEGQPQPGKTLDSITVSGPDKTSYLVGDSLDTTGLVVTAHYSDGTTAVVTSYTLSTFDSSSTGTKTITVTFDGKTATFEVVVRTEQEQAVEDAKVIAIAEYMDYFDSIDLSGYSEEAIAAFMAAKAQALEAINNATTAEEVEQALANARAALDKVISDNPKVPAAPSYNLGLIIGLSVGGAVLLAGGAVLAIILIKRKRLTAE